MKKTLLLLSLIGWGLSLQAQWVIQPVPYPTSKFILNLSPVNSNVVWGQIDINKLFRTTDGGVTWTVLNINHPGFNANYYIQSVFGLDGNTAWVAAVDFSTANSVSKIFKTSDGGQTWVHQASAFPNVKGWANFIYFFDANNGVTGGDANNGYFEIYTTTNGGANWNRVPALNLPTPTSNDYSSLSGIHTKVGNTVWFGADHMRVFKSTDKGYTWTFSNIGFPIPAQGFTEVETIAFTNQNTGLISFGTDIKRTTDGGQTWNTVIHTGPFYNSNVGAVPGTVNTFVSVGHQITNPGSSYTTDGGVTWIGLENTIRHNRVAFIDINTGWASGLSEMHKFNSILGISEEQINANSFYIYPNPGKGTYFITPATTQPFSLEVYDVVGKKVMQQQGSGFGQNFIDLSGYTKGVYLVHILSGEQRIIEKIVLQ